jgi:predicted SprT family Zn-dependent metalloprotease
MTKRQQQALREANRDFFTIANEDVQPASPPEPLAPPAAPVRPVPPDPLPSTAELQALFARYNRDHFDDRLPHARVEYSPRMLHTAGVCIPGRSLIRLGRKYHLLFPDEIGDTLKHEMIHLKCRHHNQAFRAEATRLGVAIKARSDPRLERPARYIYRCPGCGADYKRQKLLRMGSCGKCSRGGRFDARFKLLLVFSRRRPGRIYTGGGK